MNRGTVCVSAMVAVVAVLQVNAHAALPPLLSFQGRLADPAGTASTDTIDVTFKLYAVETGGADIWTEAQSVDPDARGLFSVLLGSVSALDTVDFSQSLWLGVTVGVDDEMTPRYRLATVPFAMRAASAANADNADALGSVTESTVTAIEQQVSTNTANFVANTAAISANATAVAGKANTAALIDGDTATAPVGWADLVNVPADFADGDDGLFYVPGSGIAISGDTIDADIGTGAGQVAEGDHLHDDRYFTEPEMTAALDEKARAGHEHDADYVNDEAGEVNSDRDFDFRNPTFVRNLDADTVDGLHAKEIAASSHEHSQLDASDGSPVRALTVDATGRVGIGTGAPSATLSVNGATSLTTASGYAITAAQTSPTGKTRGVSVSVESVQGIAVYGGSNATTGNTSGVFGFNASTQGTAVRGSATATSGLCFGVYGYTASPSGYGVYSNGNARVIGNLDVSGTITGTIDVANITGLTGQGYSLAWPDILDNYARLEIAGITPAGDIRCVILHGPGYDIERVSGFDQFGRPFDFPGFGDEHPLIFEAPEPRATDIRAWFDQAVPVARDCAIIIDDISGTEDCRWNLLMGVPGTYEPGLDGRTRFAIVAPEIPDNIDRWDQAGILHEDDPPVGYNPGTDSGVQVEGVLSQGYLVVEAIDEVNRTITFTWDNGEAESFEDWVIDNIHGMNNKRITSISVLDAAMFELSRRNYFGTFPLKWEVFEGFGLNTKVQMRVVISYDFWEDA